MIKEFLVTNIGRIATILVVLVVGGALITSIFNEGVGNAVEQIASEVVKQYPEAPYTAAALPATLTDAFANLRAVPGSWNNQGLCPAGSRQTPNGGCWSLLVDAAGMLNLIFPGFSRSECLSIAKSIRPDVIRRLAMVSIGVDGANAQAGAVNLFAVNPELRGATINDTAAAQCRDTVTNQWALVFR